MEPWSLHEATVWLTRETIKFLWLLDNVARLSLWQHTEQCVDDVDNEDNGHIW